MYYKFGNIEGNISEQTSQLRAIYKGIQMGTS